MQVTYKSQYLDRSMVKVSKHGHDKGFKNKSSDPEQ